MIGQADQNQSRLSNEKNQLQKSKRRTKNESIQDRNYTCGCGKAYLSYPALYLHLKNKHNGKTPSGTQLPNSNKQNRGRPKKDEQNDKIKDESKTEDEEEETLEEILNYMSVVGKNCVLEAPNKNDLYDPEIQDKFLKAFPRHEWFKQESDYDTLYKKFKNNYLNMKLPDDSNNEDKESSKQEDGHLTGDDKQSEENYELKLMKCNDIFANFLTKISKFLTVQGFVEISYFICLYRSTLNMIGYEAIKRIKPELEKDELLQFKLLINCIFSIQQKNQEFCETQTGEFCLEVCNDFILDFLPNYLQECEQLQKLSIIGKNENQMRNAVYLTQFFSNWLFQNKYTNSKLAITDDDSNLNQK